MNALTSAQSRSTAPVFVVGSARSGTTLFYDMLLSSGGFAVYLAESNVFNMLGPHFGDLRTRADREKLLRVWMDSKLFRATGLERADIESEVLEHCHNAGDFLRTVMEAMARRQGMRRWAENSVEGHIPTIKAHIPDALFIHMIRDGRDVATSLHNSRYVRTLPWKSHISLPGGGVYWEWVVERTCKAGRQFGNDYIEVHFEDLMANPQQTLAKVGGFLDHDLDYDRIRHVGYGSISRPNTHFSAELKGTFSPMGRWKKKFSEPELRRTEAMIGPTLLEQGYALASEGAKPAMNLEMRAARQLYRTVFETKWRLKRLPLVRLLRPLTPQFLDAITQAEDHPPEVRTPVSQSSSGSAQ
ncbi:MAG: sulfotransferase [Terriglobales bacterium]